MPTETYNKRSPESFVDQLMRVLSDVSSILYDLDAQLYYSKNKNEVPKFEKRIHRHIRYAHKKQMRLAYKRNNRHKRRMQGSHIALRHVREPKEKPSC